LRSRPGFGDAHVGAIDQFPGGASNITCRVSLEGVPSRDVVLRLQRDRGIFEPYDVLREGEVLRRLRGSPVPVPAVLASEPDRAGLGAPFLLLEYVDAPHMGEAGPEADFGAFTRMVATIHGLDWRGLGLEVLGVPGTTAEGVRGELEVVAGRMPGFGCDGDPLLSRALASLRRATPADGQLALCQGDINVFNYLFRKREVVAVVDWEQARIGDPRSDIGQLVALSHLKGAPFVPVQQMPFVQAYQAAAGRALSGMEYFRALWLFELGVIYEGWVAFNGTQPWYSRAELDVLLESALAELA